MAVKRDPQRVRHVVKATSAKTTTKAGTDAHTKSVRTYPAAKSAAGKRSKRTAAKSEGAGTLASTVKTPATTTRVATRTTAAASTAWKPDVRAAHVVSVLGNKRTARMLSVSESQPSRWRNAQEVPSPQVAPALVDLDHIIARLQLLWDTAVIGDWLEGPNGFLEGARPIDVLLVHGSIPVLEAIEAEASGAYA